MVAFGDSRGNELYSLCSIALFPSASIAILSSPYWDSMESEKMGGCQEVTIN